MLLRRSVDAPQGASAAVPERQYMDLRRHGLGLLGTVIRLVLITAGAGYLLAVVNGWSEPQSSIAFWAIAGLTALLLWFMVLRRFRRWAAMRAVVTGQRVSIIYRRREQGWQIPITSIVDVTTRRGPLQRLFGTGTLTITTNFSPQSAQIFDVPDVEGVRLDLLNLRDAGWSAHAAAASAQQNQWGADQMTLWAAS